jgi:stage II sporulation protein D
MKRNPSLAVLALAVVVLPMGANPARADEVAGPIRFISDAPDASVSVDARFARKPDVCPARQPRNLHAAYPGVLEVGRRSDGRLYLVAELDFPHYLKGIAEVPRNWPVEALKAQVVAARTYAISHMNPSTRVARELRYNLCATDACQVYRGLAVERGAWGGEWSRAVDETAGEILEYGGKPANTFYFSTSNGRTYSNADAFGGTALPYLRPVTETDDTGSPVSNWSVHMPLGDLSETLRLAGSWPGGAIDQISEEGETVRIGGAGNLISLTKERFRNQLNAQAVCLEPKRYPTQGPEGRPRPQVIPSKWLSVRQEGQDAVISGRGWGHGVGMVQWGVKGKADRGMTYPEILAFYYGGLRPVKRSEPGNIRIGLAIDVEEMVIERRGSIRVEGATLPEGPIRISGGPNLAFESGSAPGPELKIGKLSGTASAAVGNPASFSFELSAAANVRLHYRGPEEISGETAPEPRDRGMQTLAWDPGVLPAGGYSVTLLAADGVDEVVSEPLEVAVAGPPAPTPSPTPSPNAQSESRRLGWQGVFLGAAVLLALATVAVAISLLLRRTRGSSGSSE